MKLDQFAFLHAFTVAIGLGAPAAAMAQARLAPPNPQQERCIEAFAETQWEKKHHEAMKKFLECSERDEWSNRCAVEVFGSEKAARVFEEKVRIAVYTRRLGLLRKSAKEGHLPSVFLLAGHTTKSEEWRGIRGLPTPEESTASYRTLHDHHFPLAARELASNCWKALPEMPDKWKPFTYTEQKPAEMVPWLADVAVKREACLDLWRAAGLRGDMYAWEQLADYDLTTGANPVGIVPPVEHYAWLELEKLVWREHNGSDDANVPRMNQDDLAKGYMNDDQRREAAALAEKYVRIIWPRRIRLDEDHDVCRVIPQFAGDPEPYGSDPLPR